MDNYFIEHQKDDFKNILRKLNEATEHDISGHLVEMVKNLTQLAENGWMEQQKPTTSNIKNPYQNNGEENLHAGISYNDSYSSNYPIDM